MSNAQALEILATSFHAARQDFGPRDELATALADVVQAGMVALAGRLRTAAAGSPAPPPMLLFGGLLQCHPVRNPYQPTPSVGTTSPEQVVYETGSLFSRALLAWIAAGRAPSTLEQLAGQAGVLAERLIECANDLAEKARSKLKATGVAIDALGQLAAQQRELESRRAELERANAAALEKARGLQAEIEALEKHRAKSADEVGRLDEQLADLRSRARPIEELRHECEALNTQVEKGEQDLVALQQSRSDLIRQRHELEKKYQATQELVAEVEAQFDPDEAQKILQIWKELPADVFDQRMKKA